MDSKQFYKIKRKIWDTQSERVQNHYQNLAAKIFDDYRREHEKN